MATDINTLAEICGVSKSTISRVFTGRAKVSEELRNRVLQAARELNYRPQQVMARDCVAIVVNDLPNPNRRTSFSERILNQAVFEITRRNLLSEIISVDELARLYNGYTKAVLLLMSENYIEQHLEQFRRLSMPILTVNKQYDFSSSVNRKCRRAAHNPEMIALGTSDEGRAVIFLDFQDVVVRVEDQEKGDF